MPRKRTGTVDRSEDGKRLRIRITVTDNLGETHRPWIELDPSFDDDAAKRIAARVSKENQGQPWDAKRFQRVPKVARAADLLTVEDYVEKLWIPSRVGRVRSVRSDKTRWKKHVKPIIGSLLLSRLDTEVLRDVVQKLDAKAADIAQRFGKKMAVHCWTIVSTFLDDAVNSKLSELRVLERNPAVGVRPPDAPGKPEMQWLFPSELRQLLECDAVPLYRRQLYAAAVYCYTRAGEALALLWGRSVDLDHGMLRVNRQYDQIENRFIEHTKTKDSRHFAIEPILRPMLAAMFKRRKAELVFPTLGHLAEVLREDLLTAKVARAALHQRKDGAALMRFHDLRATGITYMAIRGDGDNAIREKAGHSDFATTQLYIRRGHLASKDIGDPWAPLPSCLLGDSSRETSRVPGGSTSSGVKDAVSVEREKGFELSTGSPEPSGTSKTSTVSDSGEAAEPPPAHAGGAQDDSGTIPDPLVIVNAARHRRLELIAELGGADQGPGLALCRGLDAAYRLAAGETGASGDLAEALLDAVAAVGGTEAGRA